MGSAAKSPVQLKKSSINDEMISSESIESRNDKSKKQKPDLFDSVNFLEAFDSPVPLVVPPSCSRFLNVRNCGTNDIELKLTVQNADATDIDTHFQLMPEETIIKPNGILAIEVTYKPITEKLDIESTQDKKTKNKTNKKSKTNNEEEYPSHVNQKRHALIEITVGDKQCCYMYPLLGSSDPEDEKIAAQKHFELTQEYVDSEGEEDSEIEMEDEEEEVEEEEEDEEDKYEVEIIDRSPRKKKKSKLSLSRSKRKQSQSEETAPSFQLPTNSEVKVKVENPEKDEYVVPYDIEIKEEPVDIQ